MSYLRSSYEPDFGILEGRIKDPGRRNDDDSAKSDSEESTVLLAVMGITGAGKTSFINVATGGSRVSESSLEPSTTGIKVQNSFYRQNSKIVLVDTPGFDSSMEPDISLLGNFVEFLRQMASKGIKLSGIIYLHRITDMKMGGSATKNLQLLREICGNQFLERVTLISTMWDIIRKDVGLSREKNLTSNYWAEIMQQGAAYLQYDGTRESAGAIIDRYLEVGLLRKSVKSNIEQEVLESQRPLQETGAGRLILEGLRQKIHQLEMKIERMKMEWKESGLDDGIRKAEEELEYDKRTLEHYSSSSNPSKPYDARGRNHQGSMIEGSGFEDFGIEKPRPSSSAQYQTKGNKREAPNRDRPSSMMENLGNQNPYMGISQPDYTYGRGTTQGGYADNNYGAAPGNNTFDQASTLHNSAHIKGASTNDYLGPHPTKDGFLNKVMSFKRSGKSSPTTSSTLGFYDAQQQNQSSNFGTGER